MIPAIAPSGPNKTAAVMPGIADSRLFDRGHAPLAASVYVTREQAMDPKEHDKKRTPKNSKNIFQNETNIAAIAIQTTMTVHRRYFISVPRPPQLAASFILGRIATYRTMAAPEFHQSRMYAIKLHFKIITLRAYRRRAGYAADCAGSERAGTAQAVHGKQGWQRLSSAIGLKEEIQLRRWATIIAHHFCYLHGLRHR